MRVQLVSAIASPEARYLCCYLSVPLLDSRPTLTYTGLNSAFVKSTLTNTITILW